MMPEWLSLTSAVPLFHDNLLLFPNFSRITNNQFNINHEIRLYRRIDAGRPRKRCTQPRKEYPTQGSCCCSSKEGCQTSCSSTSSTQERCQASPRTQEGNQTSCSSPQEGDQASPQA